jgi:hypothetical protein
MWKCAQIFQTMFSESQLIMEPSCLYWQYVWLLLMMVNFMCQLDWPEDTQYLVKYYSRCVCEGIRIIFKLVDLVRLIALHNVSGPHAIHWRPEWNKNLTVSQVKDSFSSLLALELLHKPFSAFRFKLNHLLFLGLESAGFQPGTPPLAFLFLRASDRLGLNHQLQ